MALQELGNSWGWLIGEPFTPILFSAIGDAFVEKDSGGLWWLNTGVGELTRIADSVSDFQHRLNTNASNEWFLPGLVEQLHAAGKLLNMGECYTFVTLPVYSQGTYEVANMYAVPAHEHYGLSGKMIQQIKDLGDGSLVRVSVV